MLVLVRVYLHLINEIFVHQFVLAYQGQQSVKLTVEFLALFQTDEVFFPQFFLLGNDNVKLVFFASDFSFDLGYPVGEVFAFGGLVVAVGGIGSCLGFVLVGLGLDIVEGYFTLVDLVVEGPEFILSLLGILSFVFQFGDQLLVVIFGLMQSFVQFGVD